MIVPFMEDLTTSAIGGRDVIIRRMWKKILK